MEIKRTNFRFNRIVNIEESIDDSNLMLMEQSDIDGDINVRGNTLEDGETMVVLQNCIEPYLNERYCYVKYHTFIGGDGYTKLLSIKNIIVDENLINHNLFAYIFTILLRQEDNEHSNRIMVTSGYNERFHGRIVEVANDIAYRICALYVSFTNLRHPKHIIQ